MAEITTFKQAQAEAMRRATEADLDEFDAEALLRRILRQNDIPLPESMAEKQDSSGRINPDTKAKGGVAKGKSYIETTRLVDSSLYAIVRHPQYVAGMLFNLAMMLVAFEVGKLTTKRGHILTFEEALKERYSERYSCLW